MATLFPTWKQMSLKLIVIYMYVCYIYVWRERGEGARDCYDFNYVCVDQFNATMAFASQSRKRKVPHKQSITQENLDCNIDDDDELPDEDDTNDLDLDMDDIKISRRGNMHNLVKKRRLTSEQVKFLEASFNMDLKLEPERKALIAKQLGLRPRQVAIWFQNRRARWKNKQLEHEYEALKLKYEALVKDNDLKRDGSMMEEENKKLHLEVLGFHSFVSIILFISLQF